MFAQLSERIVAAMRWSLVAGWLILIASLFFDPVTSAWTEPSATSSPFRLNGSTELIGDDAFGCPHEHPDGSIDWVGLEPGTCDSRCTTVRGECVIERPYPMGARFFWTMALPALPLAFMLFGHEAWRRVCPLSALMQMPRKLGIQRRVPHLNRQSGSVQWRYAFIGPDSWLGQHPTVLPFILLCLGVTVRLLFINSDRLALAAFFLFVIVAAMTVGYLFGGKTWCHYVCPLSPVQKIYTEPRGLFESWPHVERRAIPQSMCRKLGPDGEVSNCVGCINACPDIDLERQYWARLHESGRRFVHYGYVGMILGFYGYYALYAGSWSYYFSGAWTHEEGQVGALLSPGFAWLSDDTWMVKALAAPLTIALSVLLAYAVGVSLEKCALAIARRSGRRVSEELLRHRSYIVSGAVALNAFYFFGGRPNINLMPVALASVLDVFIVAVSAIWLARGWARTPRSYTVESVGSRLRTQLAANDIDLSDALDGRELEDLSYEEVYALGKVLPKVDSSARRRLYRDMLRDLLGSNSGALGSFQEMARELREQLSLDEGAHREVMAELGIGAGEDVGQMLDAEEVWRTNAYREALDALIRRKTDAGVALGTALRDRSVQREILVLQGAYRITDAQHSAAVDSLTGSDGAIVASANERLRHAATLKQWARYIAETATNRPIAALAVHELSEAQAGILREVLRVVCSLSGTAEANTLMRRAALTSPVQLLELLTQRIDPQGGPMTWEERLGEALTEIGRAQSRFEVDDEALQSDSAPTLDDVQSFWAIFPTMTHAALLGWWTTHDPAGAREYATQLAERDSDWLARRVASDTLEFNGHQIPDLLSWVAHLRLTEFYREASPGSIAGLLRQSEPVEAPQGHIIMRQGEPSEDVICLLDGMAEVHVKREGQDPVLVAEVHAGETVGEMGLINAEPRSATVTVATQSARYLRVPKEAFDDYLSYESRNVLQLVSRRLIQTLHRESL